MLGQDVGFPVPEGGAGELVAALVRRLVARGGRVECGRPVRQVIVADGKALGVRDADGELVRARRAVLADVPAPALYLDLVGPDHLPARVARTGRWWGRRCARSTGDCSTMDARGVDLLVAGVRGLFDF